MLRALPGKDEQKAEDNLMGISLAMLKKNKGARPVSTTADGGTRRWIVEPLLGFGRGHRPLPRQLSRDGQRGARRLRGATYKGVGLRIGERRRQRGVRRRGFRESGNGVHGDRHRRRLSHYHSRPVSSQRAGAFRRRLRNFGTKRVQIRRCASIISLSKRMAAFQANGNARCCWSSWNVNRVARI